MAGSTLHMIYPMPLLRFAIIAGQEVGSAPKDPIGFSASTSTRAFLGAKTGRAMSYRPA